MNLSTNVCSSRTGLSRVRRDLEGGGRRWFGRLSSCLALLVVPAAGLAAADSSSAPSGPASKPAGEVTRGERSPVPFTAVRLTDGFWAPKQAVYRTKTVPHSWPYVKREIEDNEIAAGWHHEARGKDTPWNQANLHKVLETAAYALGQERDPALEKKINGIVVAIAGAQQTNGYVNALITVRKMTPWANLDGQHDGYVAGHLIEAAVAHHLATGQTNFLHVACALADHIHRTFVLEQREGVCGHAELELALVRLYRVTGQARYLELALNWIERRGRRWAYTSETPRSYFMDHLPIRQVPEVTGHAVRTLFYLTGVADAAVESGDLELQECARRLWDNTVQRKMYVTGSVGTQEKDEGFGADYELPNRGGYAESCAACGLLYFAQAMFRLEGRAESIDVLERVLYNGILHGISLDGATTYYRNPLADENHPRDNCWVCCPPCLSRTLLRVPDYLYARTATDLYVNLYAGSTVTVALRDQTLKLRQQTDYPWDGRVTLTLEPERPATFGLRLRQPGWCRSATVRLNGTIIQAAAASDGYILVRREWRPGDVVVLELPMPVERLEAHPRVTADRGRVALQRGPIVYGFEALDNRGQADLILPRDPLLQAEARPDFLGGVVVIRGKTAEDQPFLAVPFYALANRAPSKQAVWVRQTGQTESVSSWEGKLYRRLDATSLRAQ
jgi:uncharacterized protein